MKSTLNSTRHKVLTMPVAISMWNRAHTQLNIFHRLLLFLRGQKQPGFWQAGWMAEMWVQMTAHLRTLNSQNSFRELLWNVLSVDINWPECKVALLCLSGILLLILGRDGGQYALSWWGWGQRQKSSYRWPHGKHNKYENELICDSHTPNCNLTFAPPCTKCICMLSDRWRVSECAVGIIKVTRLYLQI